MRIGVLNPSYEQSDSPFKGHDPLCDPSRHLPEHTWERCLVHKATAVRQVREFTSRGFDAVVNLCDGAWDEDRPGIEVVTALERLGVPFTGATSHFYEPTRETMKRVCRYWDVPTPEYVFARTEADVDLAARELRFPMIVKHENSYGSVGMTRDSKVHDAEALRTQARRMIAAHGGALIEEFVEGREFTVLVAENPADPQRPITYVPVECRFPAGETFKHFDLKWVGFDGLAWVPCDDPRLDARLREVSATLFAGLDGTGYGRCDLRVGADGEPMMLEINANCGIFYPEASYGSADTILSYDPGGHAAFLRHILEVAIARARRQQRSWEIRYRRGQGHGTYATRPIGPGEVVQAYEERAHWLVSRDHVARSWGPREQDWFRRYAWPLSDDVFVMWHRDPAEWRPIDHACDPNAWMRGLDLVARRPIATGEAITVDYATFCGDEMEPFACSCGAPACRGTIRGTDWALPDLDARYGDHVSPWIRARRRRGLVG